MPFHEQCKNYLALTVLSSFENLLSCFDYLRAVPLTVMGFLAVLTTAFLKSYFVLHMD